MGNSFRDSFIIAGLATGIVGLFVAPPFGIVTLAFVVLCALVTTSTQEHVEAVKESSNRADAAPGCAVGVLVLFGLFVVFVLVLQGIG